MIKLTMRLEDDGHCFVCGAKNPAGLRVAFNGAAGGVTARFSASKSHQGYCNIVHGGIISALLDEAMVKAAIEEGLNAVTAELTVRFKNAFLVGEEVVVEARLDKVGKIAEASSEVKRAADGALIAAGKAKLVSVER